jgi:hypothetical protein
LASGFVINAKRYPNTDEAKTKHRDQATSFFLDPDHLISPNHSAKVPLGMLARDSNASISDPSNPLNEKSRCAIFFLLPLKLSHNRIFKAACDLLIEMLRYQSAWISVEPFAVFSAGGI